MKIIIDERETDLYDRCYSILNNEEPKLLSSLHLSKEVLLLGDVLIKDDSDNILLLIERKGFQDLLASIKDGRYEEQSYRLIHTAGLHLHNVLYVLEGIFSQLKTVQEKKLIYSSATSLNYFKGFSVLKTSSVRETAELVIYMTDNGQGKDSCVFAFRYEYCRFRNKYDYEYDYGYKYGYKYNYKRAYTYQR